jgi:hypothetical protein
MSNLNGDGRMADTKLRVVEIRVSLGSPDSVWDVEAWTTRSQAEAGHYTVPSYLSQDEFFKLLEELASKIVHAHKIGDDFIVMKTSARYIVRDPNYPLCSDSIPHIESAMQAAANVSQLLSLIQAHAIPLAKGKRKRKRTK